MAYDTSKLQCVKVGGNGVVTARCPVCAMGGGDKSGNHLSILPSGAFNCIVGSSGDPSHNRQIRAWLKSKSGDGDVEYIDPEPLVKMDKVYPESKLDELLKDHSYWVNRGIREEIVKLLEGGVSPATEKSKLSNRYVIPIRGLSGQINGFSGRILTHSTFAPKYKHLFKPSRVCWPWHISGPHIEKNKKVVLNEGWSEWLALANADIWNSLCLFGLNLSDVMVGQLVASGVEEIIISTNDDADEHSKLKKGKLRALDIKRKLDNFFDPAKVKIRHPKSDWGEATPEEFVKFKEEIG